MAALRPGDVLAFTGYTWQAHFINLVTGGIPTIHIAHVGIVAQYRDELLLFESLIRGEKPCAIRGIHASGVQAGRFGHRLSEEIAHGGKVWAYYLKRPLSVSESGDLSGALHAALGISYDFAGAARSGGFIFRAIQRALRPESLESLFCSELVASVLRDVGRFDTANVSSWSPNSMIREGKRRGIWREVVRLA